MACVGCGFLTSRTGGGGLARLNRVVGVNARSPSDRLAAVAAELARMGVAVRTTEDSLRITGGQVHGAEIQTYDDHRLAMAFAVAGLRVPGVKITDPGCVAKSFPDFLERLREL